MKINPIVLVQEKNIHETIFQYSDEPSRIFIRQKCFILKNDLSDNSSYDSARHSVDYHFGSNVHESLLSW